MYVSLELLFIAIVNRFCTHRLRSFLFVGDVVSWTYVRSVFLYGILVLWVVPSRVATNLPPSYVSLAWCRESGRRRVTWGMSLYPMSTTGSIVSSPFAVIRSHAPGVDGVSFGSCTNTLIYSLSH